MLGKILQRALLICTLLFAVVLLFWTQLEYLLILAGAPCLSQHQGMCCFSTCRTQPCSCGTDASCVIAGQDEDIAGGAVFFMWRLAPALYCFTLNECLKRYLMAQVSAPIPYCSEDLCHLPRVHYIIGVAPFACH